MENGSTLLFNAYSVAYAVHAYKLTQEVCRMFLRVQNSSNFDQLPGITCLCGHRSIAGMFVILNEQCLLTR